LAEIASSLENATVPGLSLSGSFEFSGQVLFSNLDFRLQPGSWTCLLGASGSGKSTLLRVLAGLDTGGNFNGKVETDDGNGVQDRIAYMAQSDLLFPWLTVRQNVALGRRLRKQLVDESRLDELIFDVGLKEHSAKKPAQLSGGMRQRTALARTLMEDTPFVLLDEPFSALDSKTRSEMQSLSYRVLKGKTVLLVTHDIAEAMKLGNQLYILKDNKAIKHDLPSSLPVRDVTSRGILDAQARLLGELNS
jgi:putative hydroxymethylpyrimidine transport system ATP-binding protein